MTPQSAATTLLRALIARIDAGEYRAIMTDAEEACGAVAEWSESVARQAEHDLYGCSGDYGWCQECEQAREDGRQRGSAYAQAVMP